MKWYQHDPDAFLAGTIELTLEEVGAYSLILDLLYSRDANVPDDDGLVSRALHCQRRTWRKVKASLMAKGKIWITEDGKLMAKRVENTLKTFRKHQVNRSKTSSKQAEEIENTNEINKASPTITTTTTTKTIKKERDIGAIATATRPANNHNFNEFKQAYPKRDGANPWKPAENVWVAAIKAGADPQAILAGVKRYAVEARDKIGTPYIAQAKTWLREQRWTDYAATAPPLSGDAQYGWRPGLPTSEELRRKYAQEDLRGDPQDPASMVENSAGSRKH